MAAPYGQAGAQVATSRGCLKSRHQLKPRKFSRLVALEPLGDFDVTPRLPLGDFAFLLSVPFEGLIGR